MRVRAAHKRGLEHAREAQISDEASGAGEQGTVLDPPDGLTDIYRLLHARASAKRT
jgi:hypothetical protein